MATQLDVWLGPQRRKRLDAMAQTRGISISDVVSSLVRDEVSEGDRALAS